MSDEAELSFEDKVEDDPDWVKTPHLKLKTCKKINEESDIKQKYPTTEEGKMVKHCFICRSLFFSFFSTLTIFLLWSCYIKHTRCATQSEGGYRPI